ncbi:MAG: cob(I)yrinic acid a,c-diamide adenosyltransferase [Nitrospiraceae bacterium]|nr:cob(I)yrinic acid a,c-diamide adenosyltransferase [Nitrospiraceae bacterium]
MLQKKTGFVHIYTGNGKGKTTAALGLSLRAIGAGWMVLFAQFLKRGEYSEIKALRRFGDQVKICQYGSGEFVRGRPSEKEVALAQAGLRDIKEAIKKGKYDLVVLDEIDVAMHFGLIPVEDVIALLERRPPDLELVLTGRWAPKEIIECADLVTEMRMIKHYFSKDVLARTGIER